MLTTEAKKHRFSVEEYRRMGEAGIFGEDDRVELVDGEVVEMTPIGWRHVRAVNQLTDVLADLRDTGPYALSVQNPLILDEHGEHQPDLALIRRDAPEGRVPAAQDALLVMEVADTPLRYDREVKLPLYARAGILEAWLVDLRNNHVEVHSDPSPEGYRTVRLVRGNEGIPSSVVSGIRADQILPA